MIKKIGLVISPKKDSLKKEVSKVKRVLKKNGIEFVEEKEGGFGDEKVDLIMTLGGDGTFLGGIRRNLHLGVPFVGIHLGRMGFLAEVEFEEIEELVEKFKTGEYCVKERMVLEIEVGKKMLAVNEVVIRGEKATSFVGVKLYIGGEYVNSYLGDGLIVATPTGSTAYNLSAGGPIVYPFSNNYILTPIASHALTQRPLVLPTTIEKLEIRFDKSEQMVAIIDGQEQIGLDERESVWITKRKVGVKVVCKGDNDFFGVLKSKLGWGQSSGGPLDRGA